MNEIIKYGSHLITSSESEGSRKLGFIGREQDFENNYFALGARQYDAETGRFLSIDPLFEQFSAHTPYHYAFNSPVQWKDPSGLAPENEKKERVQSSLWDVYGICQFDEISDGGTQENKEEQDWWASAYTLFNELWTSINTPKDDNESASSSGTSSSSNSRLSNSQSCNGFRSTIIDQNGIVVDVIPDGDFGIYQLKGGQEWDPKTMKPTDLTFASKTESINQYKVGDIVYPVVINNSDYPIFVRSEDGGEPVRINPGEKFYSPIDGFASFHHQDQIYKVSGTWGNYATMKFTKNGRILICYSCTNDFLGTWILMGAQIYRGSGWSYDIFPELLPYARDSIIIRGK